MNLDKYILFSDTNLYSSLIKESKGLFPQLKYSQAFYVLSKYIESESRFFRKDIFFTKAIVQKTKDTLIIDSGDLLEKALKKEILALSELELDEEIKENLEIEYCLYFDLDDYIDFTKSVYAKSFSEDEQAEIRKKFNELTNMGAEELKDWKENPCSKLASLSTAPLNRVIKLKEKNQSEWTNKDYQNANKVISFISRMSKVKSGRPTKTKDGKSCPSKRDISLKNWGFDPSK